MKTLQTLLVACLSVSPAYAEMNEASTETKGWIYGESLSPFIYINEANFPDENFRNFLLTSSENLADGGLQNYGADGKLQAWEIKLITKLNVSNQNISSLEGIGYLCYLQTLDCRSNLLTTIDLSGSEVVGFQEDYYASNTSSIEVFVGNSKLLTIDLSDNPLTEINLSNTALTSFTLTGCSTVKAIDLSGNTALTYLYLGDLSAMEELNISNCTSLNQSHPTGGGLNALKVLNAAGCTSLPNTLYLNNDVPNLTVLNLSGCTNVTTISYTNHTTLEELLLSDCSNLTTLTITGNTNIKKFDVSNCPKLASTSTTKTIYLNTSCPNIEELNISGTCFTQFSYINHSSLKTLIAQNCSSLGTTDKLLLNGNSSLETLDVTGCTALTLDYLSLENVTTVKTIIVKNSGIQLYQSHLNTLLANFDDIEELDLTNCYKNTSLTLQKPTLKKLNLTGATALETLNVQGGTGMDDRCNLEELVIEGCTELKSINCNYNKIKALDLHEATKLTNIQCRGNELSVLDLEYNTKLINLYCSNNKLTELDLNNCAAIKIIDANHNDLSNINFEDCTELTNLNVSSNLLYDLNLDNNLNITHLNCSENFLNSIEISHLSKLYQFYASRCGLTDHDYKFQNHNDVELLMINGGHYERIDDYGVEHRRDPSMRVTSVDVAHMTKLRKMMCQRELLTEIDLSGNPALTFIELKDNRLLTLDLSNQTNLVNNVASKEVCDFQEQRSWEQAEVQTDNNGKQFVGIKLPNGGTAANISNLKIADTEEGTKKDINTEKIISVSGKGDYLVLAQDATKDVDLYQKWVTYNYDTNCPAADYVAGGERESERYLNVTVKTYPYIVYVNPATKSGEGIDYYSATMCLDYDAVVPEGVSAYIATGLADDKTVEELDKDKDPYSQLNLVKVADAGQVIPAGTAVILKSDENTGLFAFNKNTEFEFDGWYLNHYETDANGNQIDICRLDVNENVIEDNEIVTIPDGNILRGTLNEMNVEPNTVLTLGREKKKGSNMIGFWPFTGTTIGAHRCYILIDDLNADNADAARGVSFYFNEDTTTGVKATETNKENDVYYDLKGQQIKQPAASGIYIKHGTKVLLK